MSLAGLATADAVRIATIDLLLEQGRCFCSYSSAAASNGTLYNRCDNKNSLTILRL